MRSSVYMNHTPHLSSANLAREAVTADLTASVNELSSLSNPLGRAVRSTFITLGMDRIWGSKHDFTLHGSQGEVAKNLRPLRINIGSILDTAEFPTRHDRGFAGNTLDSIARHTIPAALEENWGILPVVGETLRLFGQDCNDDGCNVVYGADYGSNSGYTPFQDLRRVMEALPKYAQRNMQKIQELQHAQYPTSQGVPTDVRLLRGRAARWLVSNKDEVLTPKALQKNSPLYEKFVTEIQLDKEALARANQQLVERTGKGLDDYILPPSIIDELVQEQREIMAY